MSIRRFLERGVRSRQVAAAALAIVTAAVVAASGVWVFRSVPPIDPEPSFLQLVFAERATLGFLRLGFIALALYAIGSVAALVAGGRWMRTLGAQGFEADEARATDQDLAALEARLAVAEQRNLELMQLLWRLPGG